MCNESMREEFIRDGKPYRMTISVGSVVVVIVIIHWDNATSTLVFPRPTWERQSAEIREAVKNIFGEV